jgi:hypothetical protein
MRLALMECGRKLGTYLRKRQKMRREGERRDVFERYIGEIAKALNAITGEDAKRIYDALLEQARSKTAVADQQLDEDGKIVKDDDDDDFGEGVIVVPNAIAPIESAAPIAPPVFDAPKTKVALGAKPAKAAKPEPSAKPAPKGAPAIVTKKDLSSRTETEPKPALKKKPFTDDDPRLF